MVRIGLNFSSDIDLEKSSENPESTVSKHVDPEVGCPQQIFTE